MKTREKAYKPAILQIDPERSHKNIMFQQIQRISRDQRPILTLAKKCRAEIRDIIYIYIIINIFASLQSKIIITKGHCTVKY